MPDISVDTVVPNLIVAVLGFVVIRRARLNEFVFSAQKSMLGERYARASAGRQTPWMMGTVWVGIIGVGLAMMAAGVAGAIRNIVL
ncbi:hypothetical protein [Microbacterium sp. p3-SID336]|uniref:hypothetical protein n=1 Tax=Microbacterium sp. p3-SID336 TaxID=2916212 RepID=UPI0021A4464A|nr:hypothetical protein [Microbacterium sp. p3-SID336]MCT1479858.1 hypothetical protein [Microbacterium sp. p3-SID336]